MSNVPTINIDEIASFGDRAPVGEYVARLQAAEGKDSRAGKPMFVGNFVIKEGEQEGKELTVFHSLSVSKGKNGATIAGGIAEAKRTFTNVGAPLPKGFQFPLSPDHAAALYAKRLKDKDVKIVVFKEKDRDNKVDDEGKPIFYTRTKVVGLAEKAATPVAAEAKNAALDDFDFGD